MSARVELEKMMDFLSVTWDKTPEQRQNLLMLQSILEKQEVDRGLDLPSRADEARTNLLNFLGSELGKGRWSGYRQAEDLVDELIRCIRSEDE